MNRLERIVRSALYRAFPEPISTVAGQTGIWYCGAAPPDLRSMKVFAVEIRRFGSATFESKAGVCRAAVAFTIVQDDYDYSEGPDPENRMRDIINEMLGIETELDGLRVYNVRLIGSRKAYQDRTSASATFTMISEFELAFTGTP